MKKVPFENSSEEGFIFGLGQGGTSKWSSGKGVVSIGRQQLSSSVFSILAEYQLKWRKTLHSRTWYPKQPLLNGCSVNQQFFQCTDLVHHPIRNSHLYIVVSGSRYLSRSESTFYLVTSKVAPFRNTDTNSLNSHHSWRPWRHTPRPSSVFFEKFVFLLQKITRKPTI